ncbi:MAG: ATP-dependent DNA helicase [Gammaproteobacteria bacterium]
MSLADTVREQLGPDGVLAHALPDFTPRAGQTRLAGEIAAAIEAGEHLVAEAGTGIGKTFAYLLPILASGRPALISTATRTLQDQIYERDLPLVARALGRPLRFALLKGRQNYLCRERWLRLSEDWFGLAGEGIAPDALSAWARATASGDLAELPGLGENALLAGQFTADADTCLGAACPEYTRCHVFAARRRAQEADVVVVNHHLLLADAALKSEGADGLFGRVEVVVVDEAQSLPETARSSLGVSLSFAQLDELATDAARTLVALSGPDKLPPATLRLRAAVKASGSDLVEGRYTWAETAERLASRIETIAEILETLIAEFELVAEAAPLADRARSFRERILRLTSDEATSDSDFRWVDIGAKGEVKLNVSPLEPGSTLGEWIAESGASWIFTSATLAVAGRFDGIVRDLGLTAPKTLLVESPFDYARRALLYLPSALPAVEHPGYTQAVVAAAMPLVHAAGGGCFMLFTSRRALKSAASAIRALDPPYPLFVQYEAPRSRLLEDFRAAGDGLLCGTASFWEGVDVKGEALVLVVIDRLPFASPGDPLFNARLNHCRAAGGNAFTNIQIPEAVMTLKQGAGRLIRDEDDYGVLMVCDPRLQTRGYRSTFLASLPAMPISGDAEEACRFLAEHVRRADTCV